MTIEASNFTSNSEKTPIFAAKRSTVHHGSALSLTSSKFVQRLRNPRKRSKPEDVQVGDEITFLYDKKRVSGTVRYIGKTDFSTGVWCGVEIEESNGKNNGTVKGCKYFECAENHGIFIRLQKVKIVPKYTESTPNVSEGNILNTESVSVDDLGDDKNMMIALRGFSSRSKEKNTESNRNHVLNFNLKLDPLKDSSNPTSQSSSDSGIGSPLQSIPLESSTPKNNNEVVKNNYGNVVVSSYITPAPKKAIFVGSFDELDEDQLKYQEEFLMNNKNHSPNHSIEISGIENFDREKLEKFIEGKFNIMNELSVENSQTEDHFNNKNSFKRSDSISSKIPRKVSTPKSDEVDYKPVDRKTSTTEKLTNSTEISSSKEQRSQSKQKAERGSILLGKSYFSKQFSKPVVKSTKVETVQPSKTEGENDAALVMSNANVLIQADCNEPAKLKTNNSSSRHATDVTKNIHDGKATEKKGKTSKIATKQNLSSDSREKKSKIDELIDNLQNQLKERNERINQLEVSLNSSHLIKQGSVQSDLSAQIATKNDVIATLRSKIDANKILCEKSNQSFVGLSIAFQYYIVQNDRVKTKLKECLDEKNFLLKKNEEYEGCKRKQEERINEMNNMLAKEKAKSNELQNSRLLLEAEHESEILNLHKEYGEKMANLTSAHQVQTEKQVQTANEELHRQVEKLKLNYEIEIRRLKEFYKNEIDTLKERESIILKQKTDDLRSNENALKAKHGIEVKDLEVKVFNLKQENIVLQNRLAQITKDTEKDSAMQALIIPYKQLPAELDSLKAVLELKTEELKSLRLKNMDLQRKVEQYYELQVKFDLVDQENQSLKETLKQKAVLEKSISFERDALLEKFEQEHRKVSRLSMENEELMWRASNSDLSYSSPNIFEAVEEEDSPVFLKNSASFSTITPTRASTFSPKDINKRPKRNSLYDLSSFKK